MPSSLTQVPIDFPAQSEVLTKDREGKLKNFLDLPWITFFQNVLKRFRRVQPIITAAYGAQPEDVILCNTTAAGFSVTLPPAKASPSFHTKITVIKISADGHTLTVAASGGDNINGAANVNSAVQYKFWQFVSDGKSNWYVVG